MWVASQDAQELKTIREPTAFSPLGDPKLPHKKKKTVRAVTKYTQKEISKFSASVQFGLISLPCWKYFAQVWRWRLKNPDWNESYFFVNLYHMLLLNYMLCILLHQFTKNRSYDQETLYVGHYSKTSQPRQVFVATLWSYNWS